MINYSEFKIMMNLNQSYNEMVEKSLETCFNLLTRREFFEECLKNHWNTSKSK